MLDLTARALPLLYLLPTKSVPVLNPQKLKNGIFTQL
jgi:hypothetical protein